MLLKVQANLESVAGYTATFRKQERLQDQLGPEQIMDLNVRHHPFAVYLKYRSPTPGKEVVYAEGLMRTRSSPICGGLARLLVPRLAVPPDHPLRWRRPGIRSPTSAWPA